MAKEAPVIQNSKMLLISMGLALLVVVLYNVQINNIRSEDTKNTVNLLQYKMDKKVGDTISEKDDIQLVPVPTKYADGFKSVRNEVQHLNSTERGVIGKKLVRTVVKGDWVLLDDFPGADRNNPSGVLKPGLVQIAIPVNPKLSPGGTLTIDACVNVLGELQVSPGQFRTMPLIEGLIVRAIDGRGLREGGAAAVIANNIREIQVVMPKDVSRQWYNLLSYVKGQQVIVQIASPSEQKDAKDVVIHEAILKDPKLKEKLDKTDPSSGGIITGGRCSPPL